MSGLTIATIAMSITSIAISCWSICWSHKSLQRIKEINRRRVERGVRPLGDGEVR